MAAGNGGAAGVSAAEKKVECAMVSEAAEKVAAVDEVVLDAAEKLEPEVVEEAPALEVGKREEEEEEEKESGRMITLKSSDGELLDVTEASARQSQIFTQLIESGSADPHILLPIVDAETLKKVIEYCDKHATDGDNEELENWDETFINELYEDRERLFEVIRASNYLCIDGLLNLTCDKVADTLKSKTLQEIREAYNIHNDLTEEEEEEIRRENAWAFKGQSKGVKRMQSRKP
ncbi:SKP1-like protein 11 [Oryza brachyantha]|uniref:SKP1-like protein n=1 Tax=Oryza brachyantha TaxID=4533 RepID=J3MN50_ORYBR|nr:SKP1-like protein 11 [Oryza brachyantha]